MASAAARTVLELVTNIDQYLADLKKGEAGNTSFEQSALKLGKQIQGTGQNISDFGAGMSKYVTLPIVGAVAAAGGLITSMASTGDAIAKNAREAGLSAEAYQELKFAIGQAAKITDEQADMAFRKLNVSIGDAANGVVLAEDALKQLGYTQEEIESGTITTEDAFNRLTVAMQNATSEATAASLAGDLVGDKVGPKLASALRESGDQIDTLRGQFRELGLGMSQEALDASEKFSDEMDVLERQLKDVGYEIASDLLPIVLDDLIPLIRDDLIPWLRAGGEKVSEWIRWFSELSPTMKGVIAGGVALVAGLGPLLVIVGQLIVAFGTLLPAISGVGAGFVALAANPVGATLLAIAAALVAVKIAADNSTAAARRQIQAYNDQQLIQELWNKETKLSAEEQNQLKEALERTEKAAHINSKGLGDISGVTTALTGKVTLLTDEEIALEKATALTRAEQKRLEKAMEDAAKATAKQDAAIQDLADQLTGKALAAEVAKFAAAVERANQQGGMTAPEYAKAAKQVEAFVQAGATLPPVLDAIYVKQMQVGQGWDFISIMFRAHIALRQQNEGQLDAYAQKEIARLQQVLAERQRGLTAALTIARQVEDENLRASLSATDYAILQAERQRDESLKAIEPLKTTLPAIYEQARLGILAVYDRAVADAEAAGDSVGAAFARGLDQALANLGPLIVNAIRSGEGVGRAAGTMVGTEIGNSLGDAIAKAVPGRLGKMLAGFAGPIGGLIGGLVGGFVDKIFAGNSTKKAREQFARALGFNSLAELNDELRTMGAEGARLVNEGLNKIGKTDTAANQKWMRDVEKLFDDVGTSAERAAQRTQALEAELADLRTRLADLQAQSEPTWEDMIAAADELGIEISQLGPTFQQQRLTAQATQLWNSFDTLIRGGTDFNVVLQGATDELNQLVQESLIAGAAIPSNWRPALQALADSGQLIDENGEAMTDLSRLNFGDPVKSEWELIGEEIARLSQAIEDLVRQLNGDVVEAVGEVVDAFYELPDAINVRINKPGGTFSTSGVPVYEMDEGWHGRVFGPTLFLAGEKPGGEDVAFSGVGRSFSSGFDRDGRPIVINNRICLDGREVARNQVQHFGEQMEEARR